MVTLFQTLLFLFPFIFSFCAAQPQPQHTFDWGFADVTHPTTFVTQCETVALRTIKLDNGTADTSVPPYSVASFEVNGISDWQYNVSTNSSNIPWTPRHDSNAQVLVTVVDSLGNVAGFAAMITVGENTNTTCLLPAHPNPPVFSQVNVTAGGSLSTCGLWGISVKGGVPPYGAYIVATNSLIFTPFNSTSSTTRLTYKNRASPKAQMIVAIQDSTGVWGASTQAITTKGSPDTSCKGGVESSWIGDAQFETQAKALAAAQAQAHKTQQTTIALAIVFSFLGATILGLGLWYYFRYHRPVVQKFDQFDLPPPPPYDPEKGSVNSTQPDNVNLQASRSVRTTASATPSDDRSSAISGPMDLGRTVSHVDDFGSRARAASEQRRATYVIPDMSAASAVNSSPPRRANSTSPFPQGRQPSRKALEAAEERRIARDRVPPAPSLSPGGFSPYESPSSYVGPSQRQLPTPRRQPTIGSSYSQALSRQPSAMSSFQAGEPAVPEDEYEVDGAIVIQHRDASTNRIVVELPPAYAPAVNAREALDAKVASVNAGPSTVDDLGEGPYAF